MAYEDARAAWDWLGRSSYPQARRYLFGHSLGGAIAVNLATEVDDAAGLIVEGTFTSIPDVFGSMKWGWLPLGALHHAALRRRVAHRQGEGAGAGGARQRRPA